ncbi:MAG: 50S ribosomal protein L1 [Gammaproteobacteria bacterium]|nr:MAG: 50S ribosomal protein L1 [Gammaproteobacteria bacterium]
MAKLSKRMRLIRERVQPGRVYPVDEAVALLKELSMVKFVETVEAAVNLGIDPKKSDQMVRGAMVLPHGTGKTVRVAVFAQGDKARDAEEAGADVVGMEELAESIRGGNIDFDVVIATPDAMRIVGQLGPILGPRGLMPNPKDGTVTADVATAVKNAKGGQVRYRADRGGIVHCPIGKVDFDAEAIKENLRALIQELQKAKPTTAKGAYLKKITLSTTMGAGIPIEPSTLA